MTATIATATRDRSTAPLGRTDVMSWCDRLAAEAAAWAARPERWAAMVRHRPAERWYAPLATTPELSVWLITWPPGTGLTLHDHGGSAGALAVVGGELTEWYGDVRVLDAKGPALRRRRLTTGSVVGFSPVHVHEVRNVGPVPATSIHAYAPRLDGMAFYGTAVPDLPAVDGPGPAPGQAPGRGVRP